MLVASLQRRAGLAKGLLFCALVGLPAYGLMAKHRQPLQESKRDARREIEAMEEQWRTAQLSGDLAAIDRLLSEDFIGISMAGQANTKSQQLDRFRTRKLVLTRLDLEDRKIKLLGTVAIVTCLAQVEGTNEGESMKGTYRYTRVYQQVSPGVWKTTNFEATRVPNGR